MIGTTTFSTIREKLRDAYAKEGVNPIVSLDRRIRKLKNSKSADAGELESLESFRRCLHRSWTANRQSPFGPARRGEPRKQCEKAKR